MPESSRVHILNGIVYDRSVDGDFKVKRPEQIKDNIFKTVIKLPELFQTATQQATPQATPQDVVEVRNEKIIKFCKIPRKREEIQIYIGIKDREYFRNGIMMPLLKAGKIKLTIPGKPNSPKQKYQSVM